MWQYFAKSNSSIVTFDVNRIQTNSLGFSEDLVEFLSNKSAPGRFYFRNTSASAPARLGCKNGYPESASLDGITLWLMRSNASAISPSARRSANAGAGNSAGRWSVFARTLVNSLFRTGFGATALTGPVSPEVARANWMMLMVSRRVSQDIHWRPSPRRPPAPNLNGIAIRGRAPPCAARMIPKRRFTTRAPNPAPRAVSASHSRQSAGKKIVSRGARLRERFIAAIAVVTDGRCRHNHARRPLQFCKRADQVPRGVDAACAQKILARGVPASPGDGRSREMNQRVRALGPSRVEIGRPPDPMKRFHASASSGFSEMFRAARGARSNDLAPPAFPPAPCPGIPSSPKPECACARPPRKPTG